MALGLMVEVYHPLPSPKANNSLHVMFLGVVKRIVGSPVAPQLPQY
jgi:hypothetical protein